MRATRKRNLRLFPERPEPRAEAMIHGLEKSLPRSIKSLTIGKVPFSVPELVEHLEILVRPFKDLQDLREKRREASKLRARREPVLREFLRDVKSAVTGALGNESEVLVRFGIKPFRRRATKATAVATEQRKAA
ncbi:MAG TPA: hypothetical protein VFF73_31770 [Planctomycetota bacterium]|nr:hypothetical protein [Planctomycetota bacterium]